MCVVTTGVVLNGRYQLDEAIASGGMGQVWRATDVVLCRTVAVKTLLPMLGDDPDFVRRFQSEALMMASLHHPGLVEVYDYGQCADEGVMYLVMQYIDGDPLSKRLAAGGLGVDATLSILSQAARALHVAHRHGIVHRDVKPANLLVESDGTVRLVDFGIARIFAAAATTAHRVVGTALYMAPEQALGRTVTPATDVYGLGAVGYHCLAGEPPFPGDNPVQVALRHVDDEVAPLPPDIPEPVRTLIGTALAKDPADRYGTAAEFADVVDAARSDAARSGVPRSDAAAAAATLAGAPPVFGAAVPPAPVRTRAARAPSTVDDDPPDPGRRRPSPRQVAVAGAVAAVLVGLVVWLGSLFAAPADPTDQPAPAGPARGSTTRSAEAGTEGGRPTGATAPAPTSQGGAGPTAGPATPTPEPEPTTDPPSTPDTSTAPVEPPPVSSQPAASP
jgi:eukaryotic-like serine/threonine-protein kinase